jgi:hypothetical protein
MSRSQAATSGRRHARARAALAVLPALLAAFALAPATAQGKVYFTAFLGEGGTGIDRAAFDGSGLETLQFQPIGFEDGLALDVAAGRMYWTDTDASTLWSSNMDGSEPHLLLIDVSGEPLGIALDLAAGKLYWTDREGIKRASLDGEEVELLVKSQARGFIALDPAAGEMYWADLPTGTIRRAAMAVEPVVSELAVKQASPLGIAVDPVHGRLYWMNIDLKGAKREANLISSARLDGSEVQQLIERGGGEAGKGGFEGGLAVDPDAGKLYWGEATAQRIATSNLDGSEAHTLFSTSPDTPEALALDATSPHPTATSRPVIEGSAQVGEWLQCNPGEWSGTGPISLSYQWQLGGWGTLDGATGRWFVPPSEAAGEQLTCVVTARDSVDEGVASSAAVGVTALPAGAPIPTPTATRLVGGIALAYLTSSGTSARVPVFTTLAANATLTATRPRRGSVRRGGARRGRGPVAHARAGALSSRASARARSRFFPRTESATRALPPGRSAIVLRHLLPGARYALTLSLLSADGQTQRASAVLNVAPGGR